jgi:hypothetical protein
MAVANRFHAASFTATKWSTVEEKAKFANQLMAFIADDFPENKFTNAFYNRLHNCFMFIAHTDKQGFIATFFTCTEDKLEFLNLIARCPCYGSPEFTFSDVEEAVSADVRALGYVGIYQAMLGREKETQERAKLAQLRAKYEGPESSVSAEPPAEEPMVFAAAFRPASVAAPVDVQFALFG